MAAPCVSRKTLLHIMYDGKHRHITLICIPSQLGFELFLEDSTVQSIWSKDVFTNKLKSNFLLDAAKSRLINASA